MQYRQRHHQQKLWAGGPLKRNWAMVGIIVGDELVDTVGVLVISVVMRELSNENED
jgi:hypothetical protein